MVSVLGMEIPTSSTPSVSFPSTGPRSTDLNPTGQHNSALCSLCKLTLTPAILPGVHQFSLTICERRTFTSLSYRISYTYGLKKVERCWVSMAFIVKQGHRMQHAQWHRGYKTSRFIWLDIALGYRDAAVVYEILLLFIRYSTVWNTAVLNKNSF